VPTLSKLAREEGGRTKIIQYGRYLTVLLCLGQGLFMAMQWETPSRIFGAGIGNLVLYDPSHIWFYRIQTVMVLTTGTMLLMWLGEQISERGIGNGVSLVITIGILARLPQAMVSLKDMFHPAGGFEAKFNIGHGIALVLLLAGVIKNADASLDHGLVPGLDTAVVFGDLLRPGVIRAQALPYRRCRHAAGRELFRAIQEFAASDIAVNVTVE